jgi:Fur family ferric uptake transcriptional regulator
MQGLPARYEWASKEHHDHISCVNCSKISEFESDEIEQLQVLISKKLGYKMTHHILELFGVCSDCQKSQKNNFSIDSDVELSEGLRMSQSSI